MKKLMLILLLFTFTSPVVGQEIDSVKTTNNQIDLDVHFLALEGTYKARVSEKIFLGFSFSGGPLFIFLLSKNFTGDGGLVEWVRLKGLLDYELTKRIHTSLGFSYSIITENFNGYSGKSIGVEIGFFYQIEKIELGVESSIVFFKGENSKEFQSGIISTPLLIIKIPLNRW